MVVKLFGALAGFDGSITTRKQVQQWGEEEKRQRKLVALLKGQRDIKQAEALRAQQAEKETYQQVHVS